eukprot:CAMPEP_0178906594 /NCGR_PEP_ID=MMETSP0786-20121207/6911_1 /TAXON_ID=186022 /ORGANISM="Thalassionema frauenfeldii, Strain CCMP 1798" /LENGTH=752 /DNA_ID=CAMNT_0020578317 /DNA_START=61 /DNA_END=2319 /DNA_ORIENTATION=+
MVTIDTIRKDVMLNLKQRAKQSKENGDRTQALEWLQRSKLFEEDSNLALKLKQLAVYFKQHNDLEAAKDALIKSKQVQQQQQLQEDDSNGKDESKTTVGEEIPIVMTTDNDDLPNLDEENLLKNLNENETNNNNAVTFTDAEMMDEEIMVEFQLGGMPVPSSEEYDSRMHHYKQLALQHKNNGNIPKASAELTKAKKLQKVQRALQYGRENVGLRINGDDEDGWMETLSPEDSALLGELLTTKETNATTNSDFENVITNELTVEDLETMTDDDIIEFQNMGTTLPCWKDLQREATEQQAKALECKQANQIDLAKAALIESKKINVQAERLQRIQEKENSGNNGDNTDLEALLAEEDSHSNCSDGSKAKKKQQKEQNPWLSKPSNEIKAEVLRLKKENQIKEATQLLQIYKNVVAQEAKAKQLKDRQRMIAEVEQEINICRLQKKRWSFYQSFVDATKGKRQALVWNEYYKACQTALKQIPLGTMSVGVSADDDDDEDATVERLQVIEGDDNEDSILRRMVQYGTLCPIPEGVIEIRVLEVHSVEHNKNFQKMFRKIPQNTTTTTTRSPNLEVDVKFNLPCTTEETAVLHPVSSSSLQYKFQDTDSTLQLILPTKDSRDEKRLLHRMETKKLQVGVTAKLPPPESKRRGWFSSSAKKKKQDINSNEANPPFFLGRVTLDWNILLQQNCWAGDVPLVLNSKEVGGFIRLSIRTKEALDLEKYQVVTMETSIPQMSPHTSVLCFTTGGDSVVKAT